MSNNTNYLTSLLKDMRVNKANVMKENVSLTDRIKHLENEISSNRLSFVYSSDSGNRDEKEEFDRLLFEVDKDSQSSNSIIDGCF